MTRRSFKPDFRVELRPGGDEGPVIEVRGELDSGTADELMAVFRSAFAQGDPGAITLDLTGVSFIDSAGTRTVIMIERAAREKGIPLSVAAPPNEITELLRTAGVVEHFQLQPAGGGPAIGSGSILERVELELSPDAQAPARARAEVRELMAGREQTQVGDVVLLTSEIVTNAVVHPTRVAREAIGLRILTYANGIRVEVDDAGGGFDPTLPTKPEPERGRGLFLVDQFSSRWGTEHVEGDQGARFVVWFELDWSQPRNRNAASA